MMRDVSRGMFGFVRKLAISLDLCEQQHRVQIKHARHQIEPYKEYFRDKFQQKNIKMISCTFHGEQFPSQAAQCHL